MRRDQQWWEGPWPWLAYLTFYGLPWLWRQPAPAELLLSAIGIAAFLGIYGSAYRASGAWLLAAVAAIAGIGLALAPVGGGWTVFAFFAAMLAARARPRRRAIRAVLGVVAVFAVGGLAFGQPLFWWLPSLLTAFLMGGMTLSREALYDRTVTLLATREEVRRLAATVERERMARDLHDVIGRTLTLVALKADLAGRLIGPDSPAARDEVRTIADAARSGLGEVRSALSGQGAGNLDHEVAASVAALRTAGIAVQVSEGSPISSQAGALLAMTLREAVTNVIRHARAANCTIQWEVLHDDARLVVKDDGVGGEFHEGAGLTGMRSRLMAAGGSLVIRTDPPGARLIASVPL